MSFHKPLYSARIHGAIRILEDRYATARLRAREIEAHNHDSPQAAALRGKAHGYSEAIDLLRAIEKGWNLPRRLRWTDRRRKDA